jgi:hypothetical protein
LSLDDFFLCLLDLQGQQQKGKIMTDQQKELVCYSNTSDPVALGLMADIALSALDSSFTPPALDESTELRIGGRSKISQKMAISSLTCYNGKDSISIALSASGDMRQCTSRTQLPKFNG